MSKEYPCVYYDNEKCRKFSDDDTCSWCVMGPCSHETPSRGDRFRAMTDEELARILPCPYMRDVYDECKFGWHERTQTCEECKLEWLRQPAEEGETW